MCSMTDSIFSQEKHRIANSKFMTIAIKKGSEEKRSTIKFVHRGILVKIMRESLRHRVSGTL